MNSLWQVVLKSRWESWEGKEQNLMASTEGHEVEGSGSGPDIKGQRTFDPSDALGLYHALRVYTGDNVWK